MPDCDPPDEDLTDEFVDEDGESPTETDETLETNYPSGVAKLPDWVHRSSRHGWYF